MLKSERGTNMEIQKNNKNVFIEIACSIVIVIIIISVAIGWKNVSDDKKERAELLYNINYETSGKDYLDVDKLKMQMSKYSYVGMDEDEFWKKWSTLYESFQEGHCDYIIFAIDEEKKMTDNELEDLKMHIKIMQAKNNKNIEKVSIEKAIKLSAVMKVLYYDPDYETSFEVTDILMVKEDGKWKILFDSNLDGSFIKQLFDKSSKAELHPQY